MKKKLAFLLALVMILSSCLAMTACGSGGSDDSGETPAEGETITFMAPDWAIPSDEQLAAFTEETGINVEVSEVGWDDIREKIATASTAGQAAADVVEVDWSWVGEFKAAGWLEPIELADKDEFLTLDTFTVDGEVLAVPYANDYRIAYYNKEQFEQAGITEAPKTYAEVLEAAKAIKAAGIADYPLAISMNAEDFII